MSFDPIANGWRKLLNRSTETKTVLTGTLEEGWFEAQEKSDIVAGKMYTLALTDGRESLVVGTAVTKEISGTVCGGNLYLLMGENKDELDTGEPFAFCTADGYTGVFVEGVNNPAFTLTTTETVHTIDPMYLGGAVLPCVTLTTMPTAEGVALTAAESEQFEKAGATGLPVVLTHVTNDGGLSIVLCNAGGFLFDGRGNGYKYTVANASFLGFGDGWIVMREEEDGI